MGQKIHPHSFRIGVTKQWPVRWLLKGGYKKFLEEDELIRSVIRDKVGLSGIAAIEIERTSNGLKVYIKAARPGFIIGRGGKGIEELTKAIERNIEKLRGKKKIELSLTVEELKRTEISAAYVAQQIAWDIEKRLPFRRTMRRHLDQAMQNKEVKGAKVMLSGRLDGKEIARREWLRKGEMPLQTLRADIDYSQATGFTTYGTVGVKVWIYKGEVFAKAKNKK
ncbi:MAG: 30S ribosomal protein S3 [Candidatus Liptonbacteria bacterium]|nr:30S ribosomal protein S3 [Candidatus Liptonbacteria bacterium]